jgi:hypothetical protein
MNKRKIPIFSPQIPLRLGVISFALFILLAACDNLFMPNMLKDETPPPAGYGYFMMKVSDARSILPPATQYDVDDIDTFELAFTGAATINETLSSHTEKVSLPQGTYDLEVTAFKGSGAEAVAVFTGESKTSFEITAGGTASINIELFPIIASGEGRGAFAWDITLPALDSAAMTITPIDTANGTAAQTIPLTANTRNQNERELNTGFYRVLIVLEKTDYQSVYIREALHVYAGMTSEYVKEFEDSDFNSAVQPNSPDNPFLVSTVADLQKVGTGTDGWTLSAHYRQAENIGPSGMPSNWTPIGSSSNNFTGSYDGDGHTITGLTVTGSGYLGMFGYIGGSGVVKNVALIGGSVSGSACLGGIAGQNIGIVQNCSNSGSVTGTDNSIGGIVGENLGLVENCYNTGSIEGSDSVGGIVGIKNDGTVQNCYNTGSIEGNGNVGGIAGIIESGFVLNCYNIGSVSGRGGVGGIVGWISAGSVMNCVSFGASISRTSGSETTFWRVVGNNNPYGTTLADNIAWSGMTLPTGVTLDKTATGKDGDDLTASALKEMLNWENIDFDFDDIWQWNGTTAMPSLRGVGTAQAWPDWFVDPASNSINLTFNIVDEAASIVFSPAQSGAITLSKTGSGGNSATLPLTITNASEYTSIEWERGSTLLGTGATYTINAADYNVNTTYYLTIVVFKGGKPYSSTMQFMVVP